jgi:hypothetical protein
VPTGCLLKKGLFNNIRVMHMQLPLIDMIVKTKRLEAFADYVFLLSIASKIGALVIV